MIKKYIVTALDFKEKPIREIKNMKFTKTELEEFKHTIFVKTDAAQMTADNIAVFIEGLKELTLIEEKHIALLPDKVKFFKLEEITENRDSENKNQSTKKRTT